MTKPYYNQYKLVFVSHDTWTLNAPCHVTKDIVWLAQKQEYVFPSPCGLVFRHPVNVSSAKINYQVDNLFSRNFDFFMHEVCSIFD